LVAAGALPAGPRPDPDPDRLGGDRVTVAAENKPATRGGCGGAEAPRGEHENHRRWAQLRSPHQGARQPSPQVAGPRTSHPQSQNAAALPTSLPSFPRCLWIDLACVWVCFRSPSYS
jgi:hypothetical protein